VSTEPPSWLLTASGENQPSPAEVLRKLQLELSAADLQRVGDRSLVGRSGAFVGSVIESHRSLPRAMNRARNHIGDLAARGRSAASGTIILADQLNLGKGRFARSWHAPFGGLWGCMIFADNLLPRWRGFIPLAVGVACCQTVRDAYGVAANIRWVNDVLVAGKKLAGFLVEGYREPRQGEDYALIGFGININNADFPGELEASAVSLSQVCGKTIDLTDFTTTFLAKLACNFGILLVEEAAHLRGEGFAGREGCHLLLDRWVSLCDSIGKRVVYGFDVVSAPQYLAEVVGVEEGGGLRLRLPDGSLLTEYSGEIRYI
jgi:BirA family transcriptional regulator, biotin operon repressor / biotin---[acetyl-CoA-carboxylase] ligase